MLLQLSPLFSPFPAFIQPLPAPAPSHHRTVVSVHESCINGVWLIPAPSLFQFPLHSLLRQLSVCSTHLCLSFYFVCEFIWFWNLLLTPYSFLAERKPLHCTAEASLSLLTVGLEPLQSLLHPPFTSPLIFKSPVGCQVLLLNLYEFSF